MAKAVYTAARYSGLCEKHTKSTRLIYVYIPYTSLIRHHDYYCRFGYPFCVATILRQCLTNAHGCQQWLNKYLWAINTAKPRGTEPFVPLDRYLTSLQLTTVQ